MKKSLRKLIPAFVMMVVTMALLGTSTFAWFSMNNKVTVTGMEVSTKIGNNLQIAGDELSSTAKKADNLFVNGLDQPVTGLLEPVSTVNGTAFFYTSTANVASDGDTIANTFVAYAAGDDFDGNYGLNNTNSSADALGYVDYVFQLKASNTGDASADVKMTKVNLLYNGEAAAANEIKAYRVAIFVEDITAGTATAGVGTLKTILRQSGAQYWGAAKDNADQAVSAVDTISAVDTKIDDAATLDTVAASTTKYYKVVVRMWLEGEDKTCNNDTYLELNGKWTLDLAIELGGGNEAATNITTAAAAVATASTATSTVTLSDTTTGNIANGEKAVSFQWKNAADGANATGTSNQYTYTATATGDYYCLVTTARGNVYRTNAVTLTVA
jgi:hypothetical protein